MKRFVLTLFSIGLCLAFNQGFAVKRYAQSLCDKPDYFCMKIKRGQSWHSLWPDPEQRDIVRRVNRMNTRLHPGLTIAVPKNLERLTVYDVSPFPRYVESTGEKTIYINQKELAWGAYDEQGELVWWGPVSVGKNYCGDVPGGDCGTPNGSFRVIRKQGIECISSAFPKPNGGAPMPYCMHFYRGFALHGSPIVPGRPDSHGCVRMFTEDARWLNHEFIDLPGVDAKGTRVIIGEG